MLGTCIPFRIFKKRDNGVLYVAIPDLLNYFHQKRSECETKDEEEMWSNEISKFGSMVYERIDDDLLKQKELTMICEGQNPDYNEVIKTAESKIPLVCRHDFWPQAKLADYGDILLCQRCGQYFTKIKHMIWIVKPKELPPKTFPHLGKVIIKAHPNHKNRDCWVRVPVRITNGYEA